MRTLIAGAWILTGLLILPPAASQLRAQAAVEPKGDRAAIEAVIVDAYVRGVHIDRNAAAVRRGFHPDFVMSVYDDGQLITVPLQMWLDHMQLDGQPNPEAVEHRFTHIDATGDAAVARLEVFEGGTHIYTDYFGLYRFPEGWKIVNKLFHSHD